MDQDKSRQSIGPVRFSQELRWTPGGGGGLLGGVVSLSRITHHSYHGLWVDYCKLIKGLIAAASGALCAEANS